MIDKEKGKYKCPLRKSYSKAFKLKIVREVECGLFTKDGAKYRYGIAGNSTVLRWMRRYGSFPPEKTFQMKKKKRYSLEALAASKHRADLEQALEQANLKVAALETLIAVAEQELGVEIKKNLVPSR